MFERSVVKGSPGDAFMHACHASTENPSNGHAEDTLDRYPESKHKEENGNPLKQSPRKERPSKGESRMIHLLCSFAQVRARDERLIEA